MLRFFPIHISITALSCILALLVPAVCPTHDTPSKTRVALRQLVREADAGNPKAIYNLARLHDSGYDSIPVDSARSTALYRKAAASGFPAAQNYLGYRYFKGEFVSHDIDSALFWITKAALAGDATAASNLGQIYARGEGVAKDYNKAMTWLHKATDAGVPAAEVLLANLYAEGLGTKADTIKAAALYEKALSHGVREAEEAIISLMKEKWRALPTDSALTLGIKYFRGNAPLAGVMLIEMAAKEDIPQAVALIGLAASRGRGRDYDRQLAEEMFLKAALLGEPSAAYIVAEQLDMFPDSYPDSILKSLSLPTDAILPITIPEASWWYQKASEGGIDDGAAAINSLLQSDSH